MTETKFSYEQYCTFLDKNVILEEILSLNGEKKIICTNAKCMNSDEGCKNKLSVGLSMMCYKNEN